MMAYDDGKFRRLAQSLEVKHAGLRAAGELVREAADDRRDARYLSWRLMLDAGVSLPRDTPLADLLTLAATDTQFAGRVGPRFVAQVRAAQAADVRHASLTARLEKLQDDVAPLSQLVSRCRDWIAKGCPQ